MVDIHSHIIPYIDDGAIDTEEAEAMLNAAYNNGIRHIAATPHFKYGTEFNLKENIIKDVKKLQILADESGFKLSVYPGSEVMIHPEIVEQYTEGKISTINDTIYLLVEFPLNELPVYTDNTLYSMQLKGLIPIIAHPERNEAILDNYRLLYRYVERGMLSQVNAESVLGLNGRRIQETAFHLIKRGAVHFISADAHGVKHRKYRLAEAYNVIKTNFGYELAEVLFYRNGMSVLLNNEIDTDMTFSISRIIQSRKKSFYIDFRKLFMKRK